MSWLFPLGLVALAALVVPVLLHLTRRREQRVIVFAAMRWLPTGRAPRRRLRLQERGLLALRLLLLAIAALWLARPLLQDAGAPQHWLAVAPSVDPAAAQRAAAGVDRAIWLLPGFPPLQAHDDSSAQDAATPAGTVGAASAAMLPPTDSLIAADAAPTAPADATWLSALQEFAARLPAADSATVLVPDTVGGVGDRLPTLAHALDWQTAPAAADAAIPMRLLALRYTSADAPALAVLRAAIAAWDEDPAFRVQLDDAPATQRIPPGADAVLWIGPLDSAEVPPTTPLLQIAAVSGARQDAPQGGSSPFPTEPPPTTPLPTIAWEPGPPATGTADPAPAPAPHWRRLATSLTPAALPALHSPHFPHRLHATLFGPPTPQLVPATRLHDLEIAAPVATHASPALAPRGLRDQPLWPWLAAAVLLLFLLERWLATGRRLDRAQ